MSRGYRFPTYTLFIASKENPKKEKTKAGVAFPNEFGGLNLKLNPGIVLRWNDDVYFNLNPFESDQEHARRVKATLTKDDDLGCELSGEPPGGDELAEELDEEYFLDAPKDFVDDN